MKNSVNFEKDSVWSLIIRNGIPSIITMIVVIIYNLADTFFVGQTHNDMMVAAVSVAAPIFTLLITIGTLIGGGGCSIISNALGSNNLKRAKQTSAFCFYCSVAVGILFTVLILLFCNPILRLVGATDNTIEMAAAYLQIIAAGAPFIIFSNTMANVIRADGAAKESMIGNMIGTILNIVLDPIMILVFRWGIAGAAIATVLGNICACLYSVIYIKSAKSKVLSYSIADFTIKRKISFSVFSIGLPVALSNLLMSFSNIVMNMYLVPYGDGAVAAMGVAMKVGMIVAMIQMGLCMGVLPILAYNFGSSRIGKIKETISKTAILYDLQRRKELQHGQQHTEPERGTATGQVRADAKTVPTESQEDIIQSADTDRTTERASERDTADGREAGEPNNGEPVEAVTTAGEVGRDSVDKAHEHNTGDSGRSSDEETDTQLTSLSRGTQISLFDEPDEEPPKDIINQEAIDAALRKGSGFEHGKHRIYESYENHTPISETIAFLKKEYGTGGSNYVMEGSGINEWHDAKGIKLTRGENEMLISWNTAAVRIGELIRQGRYFTPEEREFHKLYSIREKAVDEFLKTGSYDKNSIMNICIEFSKGGSTYENANFLRKEFNGVNKGLNIDGVNIAFSCDDSLSDAQWEILPMVRIRYVNLFHGRARHRISRSCLMRADLHRRKFWIICTALSWKELHTASGLCVRM